MEFTNSFAFCQVSTLFFVELKTLTTAALILTGPWGTLAPVFGKKNVLLLNTISAVLGTSYFVAICNCLWDLCREKLIMPGYCRQIFNIRLIWLKPLFSIIGGGQVITSSLIMTYVAESVDSKNL